MAKLSYSSNAVPGAFGDHAVKVARRQYFQPGDETVFDMFERVARWVARPEPEERREAVAAEFYRLMAEQRFCPGGRVLAGAATEHGNVLNCFVQDGSPEPEGTNAWVLRLATKLALVTKVGGGNGLNLDPIPPKRRFAGKVGRLYLTVDPTHADYEAIRTGTFLDLVRDEMVTKGYRVAAFVEKAEAPPAAETIAVPDSVEGIWDSAGSAAMGLLAGRDVLVDLSGLRPVGSPVRGSGGTSSGPASFAVEIFDSFAVWAGGDAPVRLRARAQGHPPGRHAPRRRDGDDLDNAPRRPRLHHGEGPRAGARRGRHLHVQHLRPRHRRVHAARVAQPRRGAVGDRPACLGDGRAGPHLHRPHQRAQPVARRARRHQVDEPLRRDPALPGRAVRPRRREPRGVRGAGRRRPRGLRHGGVPPRRRHLRALPRRRPRREPLRLGGQPRDEHAAQAAGPGRDGPRGRPDQDGLRVQHR